MLKKVCEGKQQVMEMQKQNLGSKIWSCLKEEHWALHLILVKIVLMSAWNFIVLERQTYTLYHQGDEQEQTLTHEACFIIIIIKSLHYALYKKKKSLNWTEIEL